MENLSDIHVRELAAGEFARHPVWVWDDAQEGHHPLAGPGPLPTHLGTLFVRATFITPTGRRLSGYLVGLQSFYAFGLFVPGRHDVINLNLPDLARPALQALSAQLGGEPILPLQYRVDPPLEGAADISGVFGKI